MRADWNGWGAKNGMESDSNGWAGIAWDAAMRAELGGIEWGGTRWDWMGRGGMRWDWMWWGVMQWHQIDGTRCDAMLPCWM